MKWIDFPPLAEFSDRHNIIRAIHGTTIFGRFEFADRMTEIQTILDESNPSDTWEQVYLSSGRFRHAITRALDCWGIDVEWLVPSQIEQLLFYRGEEVGWLLELSKPKDNQGTSTTGTNTLAAALAAISSHCQSLSEAMELANTVPADLLLATLKAKVEQAETTTPENKGDSEKAKQLKENFDAIMGKF